MPCYSLRLSHSRRHLRVASIAHRLNLRASMYGPDWILTAKQAFQHDRRVAKMKECCKGRISGAGGSAEQRGEQQLPCYVASIIRINAL